MIFVCPIVITHSSFLFPLQFSIHFILNVQPLNIGHFTDKMQILDQRFNVEYAQKVLILTVDRIPLKYGVLIVQKWKPLSHIHMNAERRAV